MKTHIVMVFMSVLLVFAFSAISLAEPPDFDRPPTKEQMEKVRKKVETLRMWRLTDALDLDEKTSAQLFPLLGKYDKIRHEKEKELREDMRELREALDKSREGALKNILERLEANHKAIQKINDEERADLKRILTVEQQAKFIIFQQEFEKEIRRIIDEVRDRRPDRAGKERPERPLLRER